jgi:flagellar hook-length control protein FliK
MKVDSERHLDLSPRSSNADKSSADDDLTAAFAAAISQALQVSQRPAPTGLPGAPALRAQQHVSAVNESSTRSSRGKTSASTTDGVTGVVALPDSRNAARAKTFDPIDATAPASRADRSDRTSEATKIDTRRSEDASDASSAHVEEPAAEVSPADSGAHNEPVAETTTQSAPGLSTDIASEIAIDVAPEIPATLESLAVATTDAAVSEVAVNARSTSTKSSVDTTASQFAQQADVQTLTDAIPDAVAAPRQIDTAVPSAQSVSSPTAVTNQLTTDAISTLQPVAPNTGNAQPATTTVSTPSTSTAPVTGVSAVQAPRDVAPTSAAAAPTAPRSATPMPHPTTQLVSVISPLRLRADGSTKLSMVLRPEELGRVEVDLRIQHGIMHVNLRAESSETAQVLRNALDDLRTQLEQRGITTGDLGVGDGSGKQPGREAQNPQSSGITSAVVDEESFTSMDAPQPTSRDEDALVDVHM